MKAEMRLSKPLPSKVLLKLAILGGLLLAGMFGIIQLFTSAIKLLQ